MPNVSDADVGRVFSGVDVDAELETQVALQWCLVVTRSAVLLAGKKVSDEARDAWLAYYHPRFYKAITVNHRHFKDDFGHLSVKSVLLGHRAAALSTGGTVMKDAALKAANEIQCEAVKIFPELHWCAP